MVIKCDVISPFFVSIFFYWVSSPISSFFPLVAQKGSITAEGARRPDRSIKRWSVLVAIAFFSCLLWRTLSLLFLSTSSTSSFSSRALFPLAAQKGSCSFLAFGFVLPETFPTKHTIVKLTLCNVKKRKSRISLYLSCRVWPRRTVQQSCC